MRGSQLSLNKGKKRKGWGGLPLVPPPRRLRCKVVYLEFPLYYSAPPQEKGAFIRDDGPRENGEGTRRDLRGDPALLQDIRGGRLRPTGAHPPVRSRAAGEPREPGGFRQAGHSGEPGRKEQGRTRAVREAGEAYTRVLKGPVDEHHHKIEQAEADLKEWGSS